MLRSLVTIDLGAVRHNVRALRRLLARAELWVVVKADGYGHGAVDVVARHSRRARPRCALPRVGEALELRTALPGRADRRPGPTGSRRRRRGTRRPARALPSRPRAPGRRAVHVKLDTGMGRWGLAELTAPGHGCRRGDEPLRLGRLGPRVHGAAARSVPLGDRAVCAPDAPYREQRRHPAPPCRASRRGSLRDRRLRHLALRHRPCRRRPPAGARLGVLGRTREIAPSR